MKSPEMFSFHNTSVSNNAVQGGIAACLDTLSSQKQRKPSPAFYSISSCIQHETFTIVATFVIKKETKNWKINVHITVMLNA